MTGKQRRPIVLGALATYATALLVGTLLGSNATGSAALQAVVAEIGTGRVAVTWSDPLEDAPSTQQILRRLLHGAARGLAIGVAVVGFAVVSHAATVQTGRVAPMQILLGTVVAAMLAVRDELILRGAVLRAFQDSAPWLRIAVCALAGGAARAGFDPCTPVEALAGAAFGGTMAALWIVDRGAWLPLGAHVAYRAVLGPLTQGALLDVRPVATGLWGGGANDVQGGLGGLLPLVVACGVLSWFASQSRRTPTPG